MDKKQQAKKAETFRELHRDPKLLVLPNIWDPLGARLLQHLGFPAVATASAAVAYSLGYNDGEVIAFDTMIDVVRRIAESVDVPLTADIERGYADSPEGVAENARAILDAGAVGINIEDSFSERGALRPVTEQCDRIRAIRAMADREGIPLVVNARTDVWLSKKDASAEEKIEEIIDRARAYLDAGADCIYPITLGDLDILASVYAAIKAPINVYATTGAPPMRELEQAGISRLSLGPNLLKASLATMKAVALGLKNYEPYDVFTDNAMPIPEILGFVRRERES